MEQIGQKQKVISARAWTSSSLITGIRAGGYSERKAVDSRSTMRKRMSLIF